MSKYAAIDIGSNSVRMMAAEVLPNQEMTVLATDRQVIRLGESVFRSGTIDAAALDLLCNVLTRMVAAYSKFDLDAVRVVATSAVRDTSNQEEFRDRVAAIVGQPVEIISGQEEARLIHLGVQSRWAHPAHRILIIDVGGGSAELISSDHGELAAAVSKPLGAVRLNTTFLKSDPPSADERTRLERYIQEKLALPGKVFGGPYDRVISTSASAGAVVCAVNGIPRDQREQGDKLRATTKQIRKFYDDISRKTVNDRKKVIGVGDRRAEIIVPGACLFLTVLEQLDLPGMYYSTAGVRDGIIADLAARGAGHERARLDKDQLRTVEELASRYGVSLPHAKKVADIGRRLFRELESVHGLLPIYGRVLEAAAYLHDIGHFVADVGHHKHSFYLVSNSDMAGFTDPEKRLIAQLCRYHRKALPNPKHEPLQALTPEARHALQMLIPMIRLADALDHGHSQAVEDVQAHARPDGVTLLLYGGGDLQMSQWAAEGTVPAFQQLYNRKLDIVRARRREEEHSDA